MSVADKLAATRTGQGQSRHVGDGLGGDGEGDGGGADEGDDDEGDEGGADEGDGGADEGGDDDGGEGAGAMMTEYVADAVIAGDSPSLTVTVTAKVPAAVGVPLITPAELRLSPAGSPDADQV
jgi:hypothetical protein